MASFYEVLVIIIMYPTQNDSTKLKLIWSKIDQTSIIIIYPTKMIQSKLFVGKWPVRMKYVVPLLSQFCIPAIIPNRRK